MSLPPPPLLLPLSLLPIASVNVSASWRNPIATGIVRHCHASVIEAVTLASTNASASVSAIANEIGIMFDRGMIVIESAIESVNESASVSEIEIEIETIIAVMDANLTVIATVREIANENASVIVIDIALATATIHAMSKQIWTDVIRVQVAVEAESAVAAVSEVATCPPRA